MGRTSRDHPLLDGDLQLAETVITRDLRVDELYERAEDSAAELLALQAPVTTDLRVVVAAIHSARDLARMGDLALHLVRAAPPQASPVRSSRRGRGALRRDGSHRVHGRGPARRVGGSTAGR